MRNNTKINRKPKGQHQKRVKKAILETLFKGLYTSRYKMPNNSGFCHYDNGQINVVWGTNHSGELIRVI